MAEEPNQKKRRVKNPETFRERAAKATEVSEQPKRRTSLKRVAAQIVKPIRPLGRTITKPLRTKPVRLVGKIIFPAYFRNSWRELKLVTWPSWSESRRLTTAVLIFAVIFGVVIAGVDWGLDKLFRNILLK